MKVYRCDRCKAIFEPRVLKNGEKYITRKGYCGDIDLCEICMNDLNKFMENKPILLADNCEYSPVICVTSGEGYEEGKIYAQVGCNNGVQIAKMIDEGDAICSTFIHGGIGKGGINNPDNSGFPSFDYIQ